MEKIIIHTQDRTDRLDLFKKEMANERCYDYLIWPAEKNPNNPVNAISHAHKSAVRYAKERDLPMILIMENDIKFVATGALSHFLNLVKDVPDDWDLFLAGMSTGLPEVVDHSISKVGKFTGLHCYIIRARFYDKFLSASPNVNIDAWVSSPKMGGAITYCAIPMLAVTYSGYSDNSRKELDAGQYFNKYKHWKSELFGDSDKSL